MGAWLLALLLLAAPVVGAERARPATRGPLQLSAEYYAEPFATMDGALLFLFARPGDQRQTAVVVQLESPVRYVVVWRPYVHEAFAMPIPRSIVVNAFPATAAGRARQTATADWYALQGIPVAVATTADEERAHLVISETGL